MTRQKVLERMQDHDFIGIFADDEMKGYCDYKIDGDHSHIVWFCSVKGFGTPLWLFMEKLLKYNDVKSITLQISMQQSKEIVKRRFNFWIQRGFTLYDYDIDAKKLEMEKLI
jgi:hypothetical protein